MTDVPFEAYFPTPQHSAQTTWTPPPQEPEPDAYDQLVASAQALQALETPDREPSPDEIYASYFPTEETR